MSNCSAIKNAAKSGNGRPEPVRCREVTAPPTGIGRQTSAAEAGALALGRLENQADESEAGTASPAGDFPASRRGVSHGGGLEPRAPVSSRNPRRRWRRIPVEPSPSDGQPSNHAPPPGNLDLDAPIGAHVLGARAERVGIQHSPKRTVAKIPRAGSCGLAWRKIAVRPCDGTRFRLAGGLGRDRPIRGRLGGSAPGFLRAVEAPSQEERHGQPCDSKDHRPSPFVSIRNSPTGKVAHGTLATLTAAGCRTPPPPLAALVGLPPRGGYAGDFPAPEGGYAHLDNWRTREWYPALETAGVATRGRYHLRHTFATAASAGGVSLYELTRVRGTSLREIDRPYGHLAGDSEDSILGRLEARPSRSAIVRTRRRRPP